MENNDKYDIIKSSLLGSIKEILTDIADMSLDQLIETIKKEPNLLKDIPIHCCPV